jgi:four helix bundle protein
MSTIRRFEEIKAWQTARQATRLVYKLSAEGAFARDVGLRDQMRRAAVATMAHIAEGFESGSQPQFVAQLDLARASTGRLRAQACVALDVGYLSPDQFQRLTELCQKCSGQLSWLIVYLQAHTNSRRSRASGIAYHLERLASQSAGRPANLVSGT